MNRKKCRIAGILLIISIVCADLCFFGQSADTYSFYALKTEPVFHREVASSQIFEGHQFIREERLMQSSDPGVLEFLRRREKNREVRFLSRVPNGLAFCRCLQKFTNKCEGIGYQIRDIVQKGHLLMIRYIYRMDGKKKL